MNGTPASRGWRTAALPILLLVALSCLLDCRPKTEGGDPAAKDASGNAEWQPPASPGIPPEAKALHQKARTLGERGALKQAIDLLDRASALAPTWPYPLYDKAYTQLLSGDFAGALASYQSVDRLAPEGFFTTKTAIWSLTREQAGTFPKGTYQTYLQIEWEKSDADKRQIVEDLLKRAPTFAPAWKESALLQEAPDKRLADLEHGLSLSPDAETEGLLTLNRATTLDSLGKREECLRILNSLAQATNSTVATKALAKDALAMVLEKK